MPKHDKSSKKSSENNDKTVDNKNSAETLDDTKNTSENEKVANDEDDGANKNVETKETADATNKKSPAIVNLAADLSKLILELLKHKMIQWNRAWFQADEIIFGVRSLV